MALPLFAGLLAFWGWNRTRQSAPQVTPKSVTATAGMKNPVFIATAAPRNPQPGQPGYLDFLRKELAPTMVTGGNLNRAQIERIAQEITRRYFPTVDWRMLTTMAWIESSFDPNAYRFEKHINDASYGLMQVLLGTARWLYNDLGQRGMGAPDQGTLRDPIVSIYFGAAYVRWLQRQSSREEWIVRAYNGGPGWNRGETSRKMTLNHWNKYKQAKGAFYG